MGKKDEAEKVHRESMAFKRRVASHYGGRCECCGETTIEFLQLHRSNLDGAEHRKKIVAESDAMSQWKTYLKGQNWKAQDIDKFVERSSEYPVSRPDVWLWVEENGYPQDLGLTLLCANCHSVSHSKYLKCPHKRDKPKILRETIRANGIDWLCERMGCSEQSIRYAYGFDPDAPDRRAILKVIEVLESRGTFVE